MKKNLLLSGDQRAALLELLRNLSEIFWGPSRESCRAIRSESYFWPLHILRPVLAPAARAATEQIEALARSFRDDASLLDSLEETYVALFVNSLGGIPAPLYQSCYPDPGDPLADTALMGTSAVRMQQRFGASNLALASGLSEPPDHLAIEIEYLYFLLQKSWVEKSAVLLLEAAAFVKTELLGWVPRFEKRLRAAQPDSFYALAAAILVGVLPPVVDFSTQSKG